MGHPRVMPGLGVPGPRGAHGVPTGAHGGCPQVAHWVPTGCGISREISREIGCGIAGGECPLSRRPSCRAARRARLGGVLRPGRAGTPSGLCVGGCRLALGVKFVVPCYHTVPEQHTALASDLDTQPCRLVSVPRPSSQCAERETNFVRSPPPVLTRLPIVFVVVRWAMGFHAWGSLRGFPLVWSVGPWDSTHGLVGHEGV